MTTIQFASQDTPTNIVLDGLNKYINRMDENLYLNKDFKRKLNKKLIIRLSKDLEQPIIKNLNNISTNEFAVEKTDSIVNRMQNLYGKRFSDLELFTVLGYILHKKNNNKDAYKTLRFANVVMELLNYEYIADISVFVDEIKAGDSKKQHTYIKAGIKTELSIAKKCIAIREAIDNENCKK